MAILRSDLRNSVRRKLRCFPLNRTTLSGAITSSATTLTLASAAGLEPRALLQINNEVIRVHAYSGAGITDAMRGDRGTTAAAHSNGDAVTIFPNWGWTDAEINQVINIAIKWLNEGMCYVMVPKTNTLLSGYKDFGLPAGTVYPTGNIVKQVLAKASDNLYYPTLQWRHIGDRLVLNSVLGANTDVLMWIQTHQSLMTADADQLLDEKWEECLQLYCAGRLLEEFIGPRAVFYEYGATLNDRASTLDELQRQSYFMTNQATIMRDAMSRPGIPGFASRQRDS